MTLIRWCVCVYLSVKAGLGIYLFLTCQWCQFLDVGHQCSLLSSVHCPSFCPSHEQQHPTTKKKVTKEYSKKIITTYICFSSCLRDIKANIHFSCLKICMNYLTALHNICIWFLSEPHSNYLPIYFKTQAYIIQQLSAASTFGGVKAYAI